MLARALLAGWALAAALATELEAGFAEPLAKDDECGGIPAASVGQQNQQQAERCSLNALQRQATAEKRRAGSGLSASHGGSEEKGISLEARDGIEPPGVALQYNGISWTPLNVSVAADAEVHFFAIGDWGGLDGAFDPPDDLPRMITYPGGHLPGPHVFPKSRLGCSHDQLNDCFFGDGDEKKWCSPLCGFAPDIDDKAQLLVAEQFKKRAAAKDPALILNVGDNFYWGGIAKECGHPMNKIHWATKHQFDTIFEGIYEGPGIDGKPWLSVLGNHDWGGRMFTAGWDQQIAYTWASSRWLMPAAYWHQRVNIQDRYSADVFMIDSNFHDAGGRYMDLKHNLCGLDEGSNNENSSCASAGGPKDVDDCQDWFQALWAEEQQWLEQKLAHSRATWQIVVTHFPCDFSPGYWRSLHEHYGLDLLVTGHRHDQELWKANQWGPAGVLGGLTCFVTGGGGGITSEESIWKGTFTHFRPNVNTQYGFFDLTISKEAIRIESIDYMGEVLDSTTVYPRPVGDHWDR